MEDKLNIILYKLRPVYHTAIFALPLWFLRDIFTAFDQGSLYTLAVPVFIFYIYYGLFLFDHVLPLWEEAKAKKKFTVDTSKIVEQLLRLNSEATRFEKGKRRVRYALFSIIIALSLWLTTKSWTPASTL